MPPTVEAIVSFFIYARQLTQHVLRVSFVCLSLRCVVEFWPTHLFSHLAQYCALQRWKKSNTNNGHNKRRIECWGMHAQLPPLDTQMDGARVSSPPISTVVYDQKAAILNGYTYRREDARMWRGVKNPFWRGYIIVYHRPFSFALWRSLSLRNTIISILKCVLELIPNYLFRAPDYIVGRSLLSLRLTPPTILPRIVRHNIEKRNTNVE